LLTRRTLSLGVIAASRAGDEVLVALALGSCVAVCLYDPEASAGAMAHVVMPDGARMDGASPGTHMPTAIPAMLEELRALGGRRRRLLAAIAGGASLFRPETDLFAIGRRNAEAARCILGDFGIPIMLDDTGGETPRTVFLEVGSGTVIVQPSVDPVPGSPGGSHAARHVARLGAGADQAGGEAARSPRMVADPAYDRWRPPNTSAGRRRPRRT
jgi:chemotaxis protein CheD